jgi:PEP-CTERM motif
MRVMWRVLAGAVCFAAISQVSGATTLQLTGTGGTAVNVGSESVYVYPYDFSMNGSSATTQLMCLNFNNEITQGESWTVSADTVAHAANGNATLLTEYEDDAYLYSLITPTTTQDQQTLIQFAVWDILDPSGVGTASDPYWTANSTAILNLIGQASGAVGSESADFFNQFVIYVPDHDSSYYTSQNGYPDGVPQTFIGVSPAPEPGSLALLGTGLLGLGGAVRRRMRKA